MGLTRPRAHQVSDSDYKQSVRVISESNVTLSGGAPATVDGVSLSLGDRILVAGQTAGAENGLYKVTVVGTGSDGTWVRTRDGDDQGDITAGMTTMVTAGTDNADKRYKLITNDPITIGTTALTFQVAGGGSGTPGGSDTQLQFNDNGEFGGVTGLTYNKVTEDLTATGNINLGDNDYINIGAGPDLSIYHDGTDTYFDDVGTGSIFLRSGTTYIQNATGTKTSISTNSGAGQSIYFNDSLKFVTTDTGVEITGEVSATGAVSGTTGTFTGAVSGTTGTFTGTVDAADYTGDGSALTNIQASTVTATANNTTNETVYITFVDGASGSQGIETDNNLTYNPSTNVLATTASSAQYADLAERYTADKDYEAGTVVVFSDKDSEFELTESTRSHDRAVAGVISTNPAYLMNSTTEGVALALQGRVPCKVVGPINRGELVVTSDVPGTAQQLDDSSYLPGQVIGKALETIEDDSVQTIEIVVGRL